MSYSVLISPTVLIGFLGLTSLCFESLSFCNAPARLVRMTSTKFSGLFTQYVIERSIVQSSFASRLEFRFLRGLRYLGGLRFRGVFGKFGLWSSLSERPRSIPPRRENERFSFETDLRGEACMVKHVSVLICFSTSANNTQSLSVFKKPASEMRQFI